MNLEVERVLLIMGLNVIDDLPFNTWIALLAGSHGMRLLADNLVQQAERCDTHREIFAFAYLVAKFPAKMGVFESGMLSIEKMSCSLSHSSLFRRLFVQSLTDRYVCPVLRTRSPSLRPYSKAPLSRKTKCLLRLQASRTR